jgi:hypothetical protein
LRQIGFLQKKTICKVLNVEVLYISYLFFGFFQAIPATAGNWAIGRHDGVIKPSEQFLKGRQLRCGAGMTAHIGSHSGRKGMYFFQRHIET